MAYIYYGLNETSPSSTMKTLNKSDKLGLSQNNSILSNNLDKDL